MRSSTLVTSSSHAHGTKTRREPKLAPPPEEFEGLCRLTDMAYQGIINDDLAHENAAAFPSTTSMSVSASPTPRAPYPPDRHE